MHSNKNIDAVLLDELEYLLNELELINPDHEYIIHGYDILNDERNEFDLIDVMDFIDELKSIVVFDA